MNLLHKVQKKIFLKLLINHNSKKYSNINEIFDQIVQLFCIIMQNVIKCAHKIEK